MTRVKKRIIKYFADSFIKEIETAGTNFIMPYVEDGMLIKLGNISQKNQYYREVMFWWLLLNRKVKKFKSNVWGTANK